MEKVSIGHSGKTSCESEHPHGSHESWQEKLIIKMLKDAGTLDDVYNAAKMKDRNFSIPKDDNFSEIPMTIGELFYFLPKDFISETGGSWDDRLDDPKWKEIIENSSKIPGYQKQVKTFRPYPEYEENLRKRAEHNGVYCTTFHPNYSHAKWARITDYGKYPSVPKPNKYNFFGSGQDWGGGMTKKQYNEGCLIYIITLLLIIPLVIFI